MRTWTFGRNPAEFDDWSANTIGIRSPFGPWGDSILQEFPVMELNSSGRQTIGWYTPNNQHKYVLMKILMRQVKAKLGQIPIIIQCNLVTTWQAYGDYNDSVLCRLYRLITDWALDDVTNRYRDKTNLITWTYDAWFPWWGADVEEEHVAEAMWYGSENNVPQVNKIDAKAIIEKALRDNTDAMLYLEGYSNISGNDVYFNWRDNQPYNPYLEFTYIFPVEFYAPLGNGDIDLLAPMDDTLGNEFFLGAVERGETGQAVKGWVRNYSGATAHIDIWDDYPEVTLPYQSAGPGTGKLDYAEAGEPAVSQKYTVIFYSATQFEVQAEAYRENPANLHPTINGDVTWRGHVGADFNAPAGGLKIPAVAWQPGTALGDEFSFNIRGNTTDTSWPADSNDQVEMTSDIGGNPDTSNWRPITARRERTAATVTIDAATKFIAVRYVNPSNWPIGNKAFIMNDATIDEGVVQSTQKPSIGTPAFTGTGLDDFTVSGNYNGNLQRTVRVEIDGTGATDTFRYSLDGGSTWAQELIPMAGSAQLLEMGIWVDFAAITGHTLGDYWDFDIEPFGVTLTGLSVTSNSYGSGALVATSLPFRDVESVPYSVINQACGVSFSPASRLYVENPEAFSAGMELLLQKSGTAIVGESSEIVTVAPGGVNVAGGYVDLTSLMTLNYAVGDFVGGTQVGHRAFWMRPVATPITIEELKRFRLNAKIF